MIKRMLTLALASILALTLVLPVSAASSNIKEAFNLANEEREAAGLEPLKWDNDLAEAAALRAQGSTEKFSADHKRPNGQSFFSVSTKVTGENTAYGFKTAQDVVNGWMKSKGHKENILRDTYTIGAVGVARGSDGYLYWVFLFGNGKSNASWAEVKSYTFDPFNDPKVKTSSDGDSASSSKPSSEADTSTGSTSLLDKERKVTSSGIAAEVKKAATKELTVRVKNASGISSEVLKAVASDATSAKKTLAIQADTMTSTGKSVQGRMILEPARLTGRKTEIKLGVYTDSASVKGIKANMEKRYKNTMAYIHMEHTGSLTVSTKVVAKVDLTGLDSKNLQFHVYNSKKDTLTKIDKPNYAVDSKGFVTFYTSTGGDIVITDKAM